MTLSTCKNKCSIFYPDKTFIVHNWVNKGFIKCHTCNFHIKTPDNRCKCCGCKFRRSVRNKHAKTYYYTVQKPQIQKERDIIIHWKQKRYSNDLDRQEDKEDKDA